MNSLEIISETYNPVTEEWDLEIAMDEELYAMIERYMIDNNIATMQEFFIQAIERLLKDVEEAI